jgi:hypothetical protein
MKNGQKAKIYMTVKLTGVMTSVQYLDEGDQTARSEKQFDTFVGIVEQIREKPD